MLESDFGWMRLTKLHKGLNPRTTRTSCFYDFTRGELGTLWGGRCGEGAVGRALWGGRCGEGAVGRARSRHGSHEDHSECPELRLECLPHQVPRSG
jgi:hypothetical protein